MFYCLCSVALLTAQFPTAILCPMEFFPTGNADQQAILEEYVTALEKQLNTKRIDFSITERWLKRPPDSAQGKSLEEFLENVHSLGWAPSITKKTYLSRALSDSTTMMHTTNMPPFETIIEKRTARKCMLGLWCGSVGKPFIASISTFSQMTGVLGTPEQKSHEKRETEGKPN